MNTLEIVAAALAIEAACGYPAALFRAIRHPVSWIGVLIAALDRRLPRTRVAGVVALGVLLTSTGAPAVALEAGLRGIMTGGVLGTLAGGVLLAVLVSTLLAQRSLYEHVARVAAALERGLPEARAAVGHIVGRDTGALDGPAIARAAIESLAENFSDAVVAPAFYAAVLGLPGIAVYKAINTADSMIGHRTARHERFGWAAARLDDLVNLPASRLAAVWIAAASPGRAGAAVRAVLRDAGRHRSPNAGWPEAAMAGGLGLRLAGPRVYGGVLVGDAWMGDGRAEATAGDVRKALALYVRACGVQWAVYVLLGVILRGLGGG